MKSRASTRRVRCEDEILRGFTGPSVLLAEDVQKEVPRTRVTVTRTGTFTDPRYGRFSITQAMLNSFVTNFDAGVLGREVFIDRAHKPDDGAAAKLLSLSVDGDRLRADAAFTPFGVDLVKNRGFRYLSADYIEDYVDNEAGEHHGPTLLGAALTVRPVVRGLDPVELEAARAANEKIMADALDGAEALKALSESARRELKDAACRLLTPEMAEDQVKAFAENQIKLAASWFARSSNIQEDSTMTPFIKLQEQIDRRLGLADMPPAERFARTGGILLAANKRFAEKVLNIFDFEGPNFVRLSAEQKQLAGGDSVVSDASVPVSWTRTLIRESLYRLAALGFVDADVVPFSHSISIPYSFRDTAAAGRESTRAYEGQEIQRAGMTQAADTTWPIPQKLSFSVSDEIRQLTRARHVEFEAEQENIANCLRIVAEDSDRLLFNEMTRATDEFGAVEVSDEDLEPQADDSLRVFVLANFPVVRPRSVFDLQGNQVGNTVNPVTVTYNSVVREEYDGTGTQSPGIYYVLDYNLGEIHLVDESGAIQTPADATAYTISYSYATNVYNFDTDLPANTLAEDHWDTFLYRYGLRKSVISDERFHTPEFGLMRGAVMTQIEQAKTFGKNWERPATYTESDGTLGRIKDVPNFKAFGGGLWMADNRVVIGERGATKFRLLQPWSMGPLVNQHGPTGRFTGKKEAYGDQFIALHTPTPLKRAYTTLNLYSATARVARVNP